ncbi:MAG: 5'-nucleotidase C-terminal domain-containing protein [Bacteroidota bacterium]
MLTNLNKIIKKYFISGLIIFLLISCKNEQYQVNTIKGSQIEIDGNLAQDSTIINFIKPYKNQLQKEVNVVLSYTPITLTRKDGNLQSSLGNIYADVCYQKANPVFNDLSKKNIDFVLFNYGGVRQSIPKGDITVNDIFKLMPFENMLVVVELSGKKTKELFDYFEKNKWAHPISGLNLTFNNDKLSDIFIQNKPFNISKNYYVLTSDYLQHGGDHMIFFKDPVNLYSLNYKVRDAIIDYLKETDTLKAKLDDRVMVME